MLLWRKQICRAIDGAAVAVTIVLQEYAEWRLYV